MKSYEEFLQAAINEEIDISDYESKIEQLVQPDLNFMTGYWHCEIGSIRGGSPVWTPGFPSTDTCYNVLTQEGLSVNAVRRTNQWLYILRDNVGIIEENTIDLIWRPVVKIDLSCLTFEGTTSNGKPGSSTNPLYLVGT